MKETSFLLGQALSSIFISRSGNKNLANEIFCKTCLYAARILILLNKGKLVSSYHQIYLLSKELDISSENQALIDIAYKYRKNKKTKINDDYLYKTISFLNYIGQEIHNIYISKGDKRII
jgi:hypothetical protein